MRPILLRPPTTTTASPSSSLRLHASRYHSSCRPCLARSTMIKSITSPSGHQISNVNVKVGVNAMARRASSHESHFDPPTGNLFGVPPGEKYEKEGWEGLFFYGFFGSLGLAVVAYIFKPDTSIQTWALEEARRRLEREGILEDPEARKPEK